MKSGMSDNMRSIEDSIKNASWEIDAHIIKLLLLPDCREANHWKREIARFLSRVDKVKGKNKWPKATFIQKALATHNDMIDELTYQVWNNLKESNKRYLQISTITSAIKMYQKWLAEQLSAYGVVEYSAIYTKLDEVIDSTYRDYL